MLNDTDGLRVGVAVRRISFGDGIGGMERAAGDHVKGLVERGVAVTLFVPRAAIDGEAPAAVEVVDVPWPDWLGPRTPLAASYPLWVRRLASAIDAAPNQLDVLHVHGGTAGVLRPGLLGGASTIPSVANPHGMEEFNATTPLRTLGRLVLRRLARQAKHATRVVATDTVLIDVVRQHLDVTDTQIVVIPNAVDIDRLRGLVDRAALSDGFTVVSLGRLVTNKGYDLLLEALRDEAVRAELPQGWSWAHYGSGAEDASLLAAAARPPAVPLDIRSGRSDAEVQTAVAAADVFVQPSRYEGSSLTTLEAMAHGVVVVGTAVGGIPDKIQDGVTGFLATQASAADLADAILRALASSEDVGVAAAHLVEERFSSTSASASYRDLYLSLARTDEERP